MLTTSSLTALRQSRMQSSFDLCKQFLQGQQAQSLLRQQYLQRLYVRRRSAAAVGGEGDGTCRWISMLARNSSSKSSACAFPSTARTSRAQEGAGDAQTGASKLHAGERPQARHAPSNASRARSCLHLSGCTMRDTCRADGGSLSTQEGRGGGSVAAISDAAHGRRWLGQAQGVKHRGCAEQRALRYCLFTSSGALSNLRSRCSKGLSLKHDKTLRCGQQMLNIAEALKLLCHWRRLPKQVR